MFGFRHLIAVPRPQALEGVTLAAVAALTAAATPPVVAVIPPAAREVDGSVAAMGVVTIVTASLAALVAWVALRAASTKRARLWLSIGAAAAGVVATLISCAAVTGLRGTSFVRDPRELLIGGLIGGELIGFVFGTAFAPIVVSGRRARETPSHDGIDRIVLTGGALLLSFGVIRALVIPPSVPGIWLGVAAILAGALSTAGAALRFLLRLRLIDRARSGSEPGLHVVPRSGHDDERALVPALRTEAPPAGILAATGVSVPYRGERGVFKLALAPLPEQRLPRPVADFFAAAAREAASALFALFIGTTLLMIASPLLIFVSLAFSGPL
jgi:hypothetical protein